MKKIKKLSLAVLISLSFLQACTKDRVPDPTTLTHDQINFYTENFDGSNVVVPGLPAGWSGDTSNGGWKTDNDTTNSSNNTGASGKTNVVISNPITGAGGKYILVSKSISTIGYTKITVNYTARRSKHFSDNGSSIAALEFSRDGGATWTNIPYVENANDSNWSLINGTAPIFLPSSAENQPSIKFRWTATLVATPSGTYRIDDFQVNGVSL